MSKNVLYQNEIATAGQFVENHKDDIALMKLIKDLHHPYYMHSDRWSLIYDFIKENYPDAPNSVITGLAYYVEE